MSKQQIPQSNMTPQAAEKAAVLVDISGPDPRLVKAQTAPFHRASNGVTHLSSSGKLPNIAINGYRDRAVSKTGHLRACLAGVDRQTLILLPVSRGAHIKRSLDAMASSTAQVLQGTLLPQGENATAQVILPASAVMPFIRQDQRANLQQCGPAELIANAKFEVAQGGSSSSARFCGFFQVHAYTQALQHLIQGTHEWHIGRLPRSGSAPPAWLTDAMQCSLAVLEADQPLQAVSEHWASQQQKGLQKGERVWVCGTPFGTMSPQHFLNCLCSGTVANCVRGEDGSPAALLADMNTLPGLEGAPVVDEEGALVGVMGPCLTHTGFQAQLPTIIPAALVLESWQQWKQQLNAHAATSPHPSPESSPQSSLPRSQHPHPSHHLQRSTAGNLHTCPIASISSNSTAQSSETAWVERTAASSSAISSDPCSSPDAGPVSPSNSVFQLGSMSPHMKAHPHGIEARTAATQPGNDHHAPLPSSAHAPSGALTADPVRAHAAHTRLRNHSWGLVSFRGAFAHAARSVVAITVPGNVWASGVVVSQGGILVTNAHIWGSNQPRDESSQAYLPSVQVYIVSASDPQRGTWHQAKPLRSFTGSLDIAVLQLEQPVPTDLQPAHLREQAAHQGEAIAVIGHPLIHPRLGLGPSVTQGVVARVLHLGRDGGAAMLVSTAAVHAGASGGALVDQSGCLLGLVTSNTKHATAGSFFHLNFAIPERLLRPLWTHLQIHWHQKAGTAAVNSLVGLDVRSAKLDELWVLGAPEHQQHQKQHRRVSEGLQKVRQTLKRDSRVVQDTSNRSRL